jgi:hypothetical protein
MSDSTDWEEQLKAMYYNPSNPASFMGARKLQKALLQENKKKISLKKITEWLSSQEPYSLHRSVRRNFLRNRVMVTGIDDQVNYV